MSGSLSSLALSILFCSKCASPLHSSRATPSAPHGELLIHPLAGVNTIWGAVRTVPSADTFHTLSCLRNYYYFSRQLSLFISSTTVNEEAQHEQQLQNRACPCLSSRSAEKARVGPMAGLCCSRAQTDQSTEQHTPNCSWQSLATKSPPKIYFLAQQRNIEVMAHTAPRNWGKMKR